MKREDSRYLHRGTFDWTLAEEMDDKNTIAGKLSQGLKEIEAVRNANPIFDADADVYTIETHNNSVLGMIRIQGEERVIGLFNFSDQEQGVHIVELQEDYTEIFNSKKEQKPKEYIVMKPYEFLWLKNGK